MFWVPMLFLSCFAYTKPVKLVIAKKSYIGLICNVNNLIVLLSSIFRIFPPSLMSFPLKKTVFYIKMSSRSLVAGLVSGTAVLLLCK